MSACGPCPTCHHPNDCDGGPTCPICGEPLGDGGREPSGEENAGHGKG